MAAMSRRYVQVQDYSCCRFDFSPRAPAHTMHAFILFTVVQIFIFIFAPEIYKDAAPDIDRRIFALIGLKETGLMVIYFALSWVEDRALMRMTVIGRLAVVPFMLWVVGYLGGPGSALAGVLQDIFFGGWTLWALNSNQDRATDPDTYRSIEGSRMVRIVLFVAGLLEAMVGIIQLAYPEFALQDTEGYNWVSFIDDSSLSEGIHLGIRSIAFMSFLIGCYQAFIGLHGADRRVYFACGMYHAVYIMGILLAKLWQNELDRAFRIPSMHYVFGASILLSCVFILLGEQPQNKIE